MVLTIYSIFIIVGYINSLAAPESEVKEAAEGDTEEEEEGEMKDIMKWLATHSAICTVFFGINVLASRRNKKFSELFVLSLMVPTLVLLFLAGFSSVFKDSRALRTVNFQVVATFYFMGANFFTVDYLPHLAIRQVIYLINAVM